MQTFAFFVCLFCVNSRIGGKNKGVTLPMYCDSGYEVIYRDNPTVVQKPNNQTTT